MVGKDNTNNGGPATFLSLVTNPSNDNETPFAEEGPPIRRDGKTAPPSSDGNPSDS